jgi:hypothetical protein
VRPGSETSTHGPVQIAQKACRDMLRQICFLHPVGSVGHVVHSGACRARNVNAPFFMFGWDRFGFSNKRDGTCYAELVFWHPMVSAGHVVHFGAFGCETSMLGPVQIHQKDDRDMLRQTCVLVSVGICGSRIAFQSVRGMKHRRTILHTRLGPVRIPQKARRDTLR